MDLILRPRRLRRAEAIRQMVRENKVSPEDFIYPLFVHEGSDIQDILPLIEDVENLIENKEEKD